MADSRTNHYKEQQPLLQWHLGTIKINISAVRGSNALPGIDHHYHASFSFCFNYDQHLQERIRGMRRAALLLHSLTVKLTDVPSSAAGSRVEREKGQTWPGARIDDAQHVAPLHTCGNQPQTAEESVLSPREGVYVRQRL